MKLLTFAALVLLFVLSNQHKVAKYHTRRLLLFAEKSSSSLYLLDVKTKLHYQLSLAKQFNPIAVAYDSATGRVFWSSVDKPHSYIKSALLDGDDERVLLPKSFARSKEKDNGPTVVDGLAFDPVHRRIYYTDTGPHTICSMDATGDKHRVLVYSGLEQPRSIVVEPESRKMYWTDWGRKPHIARANMDDGSEVELLIQDNTTMTWPNALAIDTNTNEMFWCDGHLSRIEKASLSGKSRRLLSQSSGQHYFGLTIDKDYVYVTNWNYGGISRVSRSGGEVVAFGPKFSGVTMNGLLYIEDTKYFAEAFDVDDYEDEEEDAEEDEEEENENVKEAVKKYKYAAESNNEVSKNTQVNDSPIAFCAQRFSPLKPADKIKFDTVPLNDGSSFNVNSSTFTPPANGIYWLQVTVGLHKETPTDVRLQSSNALSTTLNVIRLKKNVALMDTVTGVELLQISDADKNNALSLSTVSPLVADLHAPVEFCGFQLDNVMHTLVTFSIERRVSMSTDGQKTEDILAFDTHGGWRYNINRYSVPVEGIWVVSSKCVASKESLLYYRLYTSTYVSETYSADYFYTAENNIETRTAVARAKKQEFIYLIFTPPIMGTLEYKAFLSAFLYYPKHAQPISWCLSLTRPLNQTFDSLRFNIIISEEGDGWNEDKGIYTVPASGVYYVNIQAGIRGSGYSNIRMELLVNNKVAAAVVSSGAVSDENDKATRSRATILHLAIGDQMRVRIPPNHQLYASDTSYLTVFCGFRIYA